MSTNTDWS